MLASRLLRSPCARAGLRPGRLSIKIPRPRINAPLTASTRVFATTPRHRKDDSRARAVAAEVQSKPESKESVKPESVEKEKPADPSEPARKDPLLAEQTVSNKEQRKADWAIIKDMAHYLWPKDDFGTRFRVGLSVALLVGAKVRLSRHYPAVCMLIAYVGSQCTSALLLQEHSGLDECGLCCGGRDGHDCCRCHYLRL